MRRTACWLALAVIAAPPARALPPPPADPPARYGPVVQCLDGYAVTVAADEAVLVMQDGFSLVTQGYLINLSTGPSPYGAQQRSSEVDHPRLGRLVRYEWGAGEDRRVENLLPRVEGRHPVVLRSTVPNEQAALARIARAGPGECGTFNAPDFPGAHPDALRWAPALHPGPLYRCEGRVGYALRVGEALRRPWPPFGPNVPSRAVLPDAHLAIHGAYRAPPAFTGPIAAGYRMSVEKNVYHGPHVLLSPPTPLLRRQRPRAVRPDYEIRIAFAPGREAAAREFAGRLEFVATGDPRCGPPPPD